MPEPTRESPRPPRPAGAWTPERRRAARRAILVPLRGVALTVAAVVILVLALNAVATVVTRPRGGGHHNESAAVASLLNLSSSQEEFRSLTAVDVDGDGVGEYGFFQELAGSVPLRTDPQGHVTSGPRLSPPILSGTFRTLNAQGAVSSAGYLLRLHVPDAGGAGLSETACSTGRGSRSGERFSTPPPPTSSVPSAPRRMIGGDAAIDTDLTERLWCAYAWPAIYGTSGTRTFFVNQDGAILATDCATYSGPTGPAPGAAFASGGLRVITGSPANGSKGQDGNVWVRVN